MPFFTTACPRNCYSTCLLQVEIEDGVLRRVLPHLGNPATAEGACLKGLSYVERQVAADRILHPLRRRPSGGFERVGWDEALDLIAAKLRQLAPEPRSVMFYSASGTKGLLGGCALDFWRLYGGCTTTYGDLCWPAGLEATRLTFGDVRQSPPDDLACARLILFWGKNPAETNIHQMSAVHRAKQAGARVVVIDPRRTETAEVAELLIQPRPGSDAALALALAHQLIVEEMVDRDFVARHVLGFERFRERALAMSPVRAERLCGVPAASIVRLARWIGTISPFTLCAGYGMQRYSNSGQTMRTLLALPVLTGNLGRPGAGWVYANLASHLFSEPKDPLALYPPERDEDPVRVSLSTALLGRHMLTQSAPRLRMAWVERGNPLSQNPDTHTLRKAFRSLELRVVVEQFMTDTAREADLILPAKSWLEQSDVLTAYWHPFIQLKPKLLEPPGEVKPETEIYRALAARLGLPQADVDARIPGPGEDVVEAWLEARLAPHGLSLARLREGPATAPTGDEVAWADLDFPTPSGKIELASEEAAARWGVDPVAGFTPLEEGLEGLARRPPPYPLHLLTPNTKNRIHSQFNNLPSIREIEPRARLHLGAAEAAARGLANGERVRVFNDRGALELELAVEHDLRSGVAWISNGWQLAEEGAVNLLSAARETDMAHGAAFHDNLVEVVRA